MRTNNNRAEQQMNGWFICRSVQNRIHSVRTGEVQGRGEEGRSCFGRLGRIQCNLIVSEYDEEADDDEGKWQKQLCVPDAEGVSFIGRSHFHY